MEEKPRRVQQRRTKGWRKPENTVSVARPSKWGNPYRVGSSLEVVAYDDENRFWVSARQNARVTPELSVMLYRQLWLTTWAPRDFPTHGFLDFSELRGKNLMCFCPLDQPCHADVLLEIANGGDL